MQELCENLLHSIDTLHVVRSRSSSYNKGNLYHFGPARAWEGNSSKKNGFFQSKEENNPWLELRLNKPVNISTVTIINTKHCCGSRLSNVQIRAGMLPGVENEILGFFKGPGHTGGVHVIPLEKTVSATYLYFHMKGSGVLQVNGVRLNQDVPPTIGESSMN